MQIGRTNSGKLLSASTASAAATRLAGSLGVAAVETIIAVGHDHAIAVRVDEDCGESSVHPREARATAAVDSLACERGQHTVAVRVLAGRTAERSGQRRPATEPCDRDRRVGGAAAINDEEVLRLGFSVRLWKAIDLEYFIEHDDPGAQDHGGAGALIFHPCFATRLGGVSGGKETQGWRDSSHTAMVGAGKFGSAKLPMATATYPGKPSLSQ
jgi:hypothetical protein